MIQIKNYKIASCTIKKGRVCRLGGRVEGKNIGVGAMEFRMVGEGKKVEQPGIEPGAFRMQSGRAATALLPHVPVNVDFRQYIIVFLGWGW